MVDATPTGRDETPTQRADRNWDELMQELRVTQTGTQILTAFLLTLPFQPRFTDLTSWQRGHFLALVVLAVTTTILLVAPVVLHRHLFQQGHKRDLVAVANTLARIGFVTLALVVMGTVAFVFDLVTGSPGTWIALGWVVAFIAALWLLLPWWMGRRRGSHRHRD